MKILIKFILIAFVVISFSIGILNLGLLYLIHDFRYLLFAIPCFAVSYEINQEIIEKEEIAELNEKI